MKKAYNFRFDPEVIKKLDRLAEKHNRNRTNMIETLIIEADINLNTEL